MKVQLFIPCCIDQLYPQTAFNAGFRDEARSVCSKFLKDFEGADYIVGPSASCVGFVRNYYGQLFENSSQHNQVKDLGKRIYEFTEFLTEVLKIENYGAELTGKATYHDSCAALRECRIKEGPRRLLSHVKGLELVEMNDVETCCGFGGTFSVKFDAISAGMADQKISNALATGAEYLISTDMSCLMQLEGYIRGKNLSLKTMHIADVLASGWE